MGEHLIHSNELHLIKKENIHREVKKMVDSLGIAAGSTSNFNIYQVVEMYFKDIDKRRQINRLLDIKEDLYQLTEEFGIE